MFSGLRSAPQSVSGLAAPQLKPSPVTLPPGRCNKHFRGKSGTITPPDSVYRSNTDCAWIIDIPRGYYIFMKISDIDLE